MRDKGEIAIYKRDNYYIGQYYMNGKRKTISAKTRKEIQQKLSKIHVEMKER